MDILIYVLYPQSHPQAHKNTFCSTTKVPRPPFLFKEVCQAHCDDNDNCNNIDDHNNMKNHTQLYGNQMMAEFELHITRVGVEVGVAIRGNWQKIIATIDMEKNQPIYLKVVWLVGEIIVESWHNWIFFSLNCVLIRRRTEYGVVCVSIIASEYSDSNITVVIQIDKMSLLIRVMCWCWIG